MDEFKAAIAKMLSGETVDFFTDDSGNFAFRLLSDKLYIDGWGDDGVRVRESFYYYNSSILSETVSVLNIFFKATP